MISNSKKIISLKKLILISIISFIYILFSPLSVYAKDKVNIYFFNGEGCSHCEEFKTWINGIKTEYGNLFEVKDYETWHNEENASLMYRVAEVRGEEVEGVPYIVIGDHSWLGFHESNISEIMTTIESEYEKDSSERYDVMNLINNNSNNQKVDSSENNIDEETTIESNDDNGTTAALFIMVGIVIIIITVVLVTKDKKSKKETKEITMNTKILLGLSILVISIILLVLFFVGDDDNNPGVLGTYRAFSSSIGMRYTIVLKEDNQCTYTTLYTKSSKAVPSTNECTYTLNGLNLKLVLVNKVVTEYDEPYSELYYTFDDSFVSFKQDSGLTYLKDLNEKD